MNSFFWRKRDVFFFFLLAVFTGGALHLFDRQVNPVVDRMPAQIPDVAAQHDGYCPNGGSPPDCVTLPNTNYGNHPDVQRMIEAARIAAAANPGACNYCWRFVKYALCFPDTLLRDPPPPPWRPTRALGACRRSGAMPPVRLRGPVRDISFATLSSLRGQTIENATGEEEDGEEGEEDGEGADDEVDPLRRSGVACDTGSLVLQSPQERYAADAGRDLALEGFINLQDNAATRVDNASDAPTGSILVYSNAQIPGCGRHQCTRRSTRECSRWNHNADGQRTSCRRFRCIQSREVFRRAGHIEIVGERGNPGSYIYDHESSGPISERASPCYELTGVWAKRSIWEASQQ